MTEELNARIADARERVEEGRRVRAELAPAREQQSDAAVRAQRLEACLSEVEQQLAALSSFSLTGLMGSLMGTKQGQIDERRAELSELEGQFTASRSALESLECQVAALEQELAGFDGAEREFEEACEEKARLIRERGDESAQELDRIEAELTGATEVVRRSEKAEESGRQLIRHLESFERAVRNAKTNMQMSGRGLGAVGQLVGSAVAGMGPKSVLRLAGDAMQRFLRDSGEVPLTDHPDDVELMRIRAELEAFGARLSGEAMGLGNWQDTATLSARQDVQAVLNHLKAKAADARALATGLQARRGEWIEGADSRG